MLSRLQSKIVQLSSRWSRRKGIFKPTTAMLRQRAGTVARQADIRRAVVDALPFMIALLDADGVIILVNNAWQFGANTNALLTPDFGVGMNYLHLCDGIAEAREMARGIRCVLARTSPMFQIEYPCHSPNEERWFELTAVPLNYEQLAGVSLSHVNITLRKVAERNMLASAQRLADAQQIAHIGSWEFDLVTKRGVLSDEMCRLLYCRASSEPLDCADFLALAHPDDYSKLARAMQPVAVGAPWILLEYRSHPALGPVRLLSAIVHVECDANGQGLRVRGTAQDISERQRSQLLSARMAALVDSSEDAIISKDMQGRITSWNAGAERIFGYTAQEMLGQSLLRLTPIEQLAEQAAILQRLQAGFRIEHFETTLLTRYGELIDVSLSISPIKDEHGNTIGVSKVMRDISERRQINLTLRRDAERLQQLSRRLMASEEEERRRLGRDLHDQTGSNLTAMTLGLQVLRTKLPAALAAELTPRIDDLESLLRETIMHIRDVLENLRPPALDEFGVLAALRYYVQAVAARSHLKLDVGGQEPSPRLSPEVEIALFRIAQEALTNVLKHAHAHRVTITLERDSSSLRFLIQDDGCGFADDSSLSARHSLGMTSMRERAQAIGATLLLQSTIGVGTRILVELTQPAVVPTEPHTAVSAP